MLRKNRGKKVQKCFLYSHEYRDQKIAEQKRAKQFSRSTRIVRAKKFGKKSSEKSAKNVFYLNTNIVTKK